MLTFILNFQALSILNLREREFREGDLKVLQNAFAKKLALGESSQVIIFFSSGKHSSLFALTTSNERVGFSLVQKL
jgi:hypothetical protein